RRTATSAATLLGKAHRDMGARLRGVVLDLRGNSGGLLKQSIALASLFLADGLVSETTGRAPGSRNSFLAKPKGPVERLPLAVLVNGGSASAAEILAAALQDSGRAVVIGTSSFGKGTVQKVFRTKNGGELTVTWAELLAPRGYRLDHHGVVPTLCTSDTGGLQLAPTRLAAPRAALDDAGWQRLRSRCPPRRERSMADLRIAERLIGAPALYRADLLGGPEDEAEARLP
ncbi:MAG: S41 family peptidase, partial [Stellaceae bacterium]